jgi:hypothetical protein
MSLQSRIFAFAVLAALMTGAGCKKKDVVEEGAPAADAPAPATPPPPPDVAPPAPPPDLPKEEAEKDVAVPDLKGKTVVEAVKIVTDAGLLIRLAEARERKGATPGTIIAQTPAPGQKAERLTVVVLTPADAPPPPPAQVDVPSVKGQTLEQAKLTLFEKGFSPRLGKPVFTGGAPGKVVQQTPAASAKAAQGSVVVIVPEKAVIRVPDLQKRPVVDAVLQLRKADLDWNGRERVSRDVPPGTVIDQEPKAGANVDHDQEITLTVAKAPPGDARPPKYCDDVDDVHKLRHKDLEEVTRLLGKVLPRNYVSAIELEPASPVQRGMGEHVQVSFSYATEFGKDALIYVIPRHDGKDVAGVSRIQFKTEGDGQGTFKGSFTGYSWLKAPLVIDELYVVMYRMSPGVWGKKIVETRMPVKIRFASR